MFKRIKTSEANKEIISQLTRKLSLGKENTIAKMAFTYSLSKDRKLELTDIKDSNGKEYAKSVLFGDHEDVYLGMLCTHYGMHYSSGNNSISKYVKMHVDDGLELLNEELNEESNLDGFDFVVNLIAN